MVIDLYGAMHNIQMIGSALEGERVALSYIIERNKERNQGRTPDDTDLDRTLEIQQMLDVLAAKMEVYNRVVEVLIEGGMLQRGH
jgi:hypothetical protein